MELPVLHSARLTLRPLQPADVEDVATIIESPGVREWWGTPEPQRLRADVGEDDNAFVIEIDGAVAGWLAVNEENEPDYRHASLDIMLGLPHQDCGLGSEALRLAAGWLISERGHHRLTIDPALHNRRAIRAYEAVGFRAVGVMRRYERGADGEWHDGLLMDLLAGELRPATVP